MWCSRRAHAYFWQLARDLGDDGFSNRCDILRSSSGAAYHAANNNIGIESREDFIDYMMVHVGWSQEASEDAADEIEEVPPPLPEVPLPKERKKKERPRHVRKPLV